jgi:hypothetical protein
MGKDDYSYKIGDTLTIGLPSSNKIFAFITEYSTVLTLNGQRPENLSVSQSFTTSIVKKISVAGNKRTGFKMYIVGGGVCGI